MKNSQQLRAERQELLVEVDALAALMEGDEARDLNEDEQARFDELTAEESGEIAKLDKSIKAAVQREDAIKRSRERLLESQGVEVPKGAGLQQPSGSVEPDVKLKGQKPKHFDNARDAHLSGCWIQALTGLGDVKQAVTDMNRFGWEEYAVQLEGVGSKGGLFVPEPMITEIIKNRDAVGVIPQVARRFDMSSETLEIPQETSRPTVYYPGEDEDVTLSEWAVGENKLQVVERACAVALTKRLIADSAISAADYTVDTAAYEMAYAMDNEGINGDGSSTYGGETGLLNNLLAGQTETAATNSDTLAELVATEWTGAIAELPGKYLARNPSWIFSRETWANSVLPLSVAAGGNTTANMAQGAGQMTWLGYPVHLTDLMPAAAPSTVVALFGDWASALALGDRNDMTIESDSSIRFLKRQVVIMFTHRYDLLVHNTGAYSALKTAA